MPRKSTSHIKSPLSWWQITAVSFFGFGVLALLFAFIPPSYSPTSLKIGLALAIIATVAAVWNWRTGIWWARFSVTFLGSLQFLAISMRAWNGAVPIVWVWIFPILGAYLIAWALPAISPAVSSFLWREHTVPQTRLGRLLLGLIITLGPVAGVLGASLGMFGSRSGEIGLSLAVLGSLMSITAISIAFAVAYQLWPDRPWAQSEKEGEA